MAMRVTIRQLAEHVGLSRQTVSAILGDKAHLYRPATRERVLRGARELGYLPNAAARMIREGRFGTIALLLSQRPSSGTLPQDTLHGIRAGLRRHDLRLLVESLPDEMLSSDGVLPRILSEWCCDGLVINYTDHIPQGMIELIQEHAIPSVWLNCKLDADCVYPDDHDAGRRAAEHLLELGHRRIAYVDYSHDGAALDDAHYSASDRLAGCIEAAEAAGLDEPVRQIGRSIATPDRAEAARAWLADDERPMAVVTYSHADAVAIQFAAQGLGLAVPGDLSIVTFDERPYGLTGKVLTTLLVPTVAVGEAAVSMALEKIADPKTDLPPRAIRFGFAAGATAAAPRE
jgi:LacI family transcriptional regulator